MRMAEVVHRNLESMLPELEELERSGIFSHEEIRMVVRRRRNLEYRLLRRPAKKEDFLRAIQYEVHLDLLRRHRKKKLGVVSTRNDAEYRIQNRIHSLFQRALKKFKGDLKLWLQYIEFSKRSQHRLSLGRTFGKALAIHPNKPGLWVMAAKFEFEEQKDVSSARVLLQQGLRANPCSKHLWIEYFRMELMHADKLKKRRNVLGLDQEEDETAAAASDELLAFKTASIVYKQALKAIPGDLEFRVSFLPIYQLFDGTEDRQEEVYLSIRADFPSHPLCWDTLARRPWCGVDTATLTDKETMELEAKSEEVFREGMETAKNGAAAIWEKYIQWCMERAQLLSQSDALQDKAVQRLLAAFKQAASNHCLSEIMFEQYVQSLQGLGQSEEASDVAVQATEAHPHSVSMWLLRLRTQCGVAHGGVAGAGAHGVVAVGGAHGGVAGGGAHGGVAGGGAHGRVAGGGGSHDALCRDALEQVPRESSLPLWQHWIEHNIAVTQSPDTDTETIFQAGTDCGVPSIRGILSLQYLDWAVMTGGIRKARRVYRRLLEAHEPVQYSMYEQCIAVEKLAENPSMRRIRDLFERAVRDYGSQHPGLWLQYICAEMEMSGGKVESIGKLHWRAMNTLQPKLTAEFIAQYSLLQTVK